MSISTHPSFFFGRPGRLQVMATGKAAAARRVAAMEVTGEVAAVRAQDVFVRRKHALKIAFT
jgi:hypothetical protein